MSVGEAGRRGSSNQTDASPSTTPSATQHAIEIERLTTDGDRTEGEVCRTRDWGELEALEIVLDIGSVLKEALDVAAKHVETLNVCGEDSSGEPEGLRN